MAAETLIDGTATERPRNGLLRAWKLLSAQRKAMAGGAIVLAFVFMAVFAPLLTPVDPFLFATMKTAKKPIMTIYNAVGAFGRVLFVLDK